MKGRNDKNNSVSAASYTLERIEFVNHHSNQINSINMIRLNWYVRS